MTATASPSSGARLAGALLALAVLGAIVLLFVVLYLVVTPLPAAFEAMGVVALVLAGASYLLQSVSRDPSVQRAVAWGLGAMGFVLLLVTPWVVPPLPSLTTQVVASLVVLVVLIVTLALVVWRTGDVAGMEARRTRRDAWDQSRPPSAFDYAAAQTPGTQAAASTPPPAPPRQV